MPIFNCLQSVLNAADRSIAGGVRRLDHITVVVTHLLVSFHVSASSLNWPSSSTESSTALLLKQRRMHSGRGGAIAVGLKNRDARTIKSRFYQSQNAPKLAFLSSKIGEKILGRGTAPSPDSLLGSGTPFLFPL